MGARYSKGMTLGNAAVAYADSDSFTSSFTDTGLTNGTKYFYKVYNHDQYFVYSSGNVPSSDGIISVPTSRSSPSPLWCYSFGYPSTLQPVTLAGSTLFTSSNFGTVTASTISTNLDIDGQERWRPARLRGPVQNRFVVGDFIGLPGKHIITGDQSGYAYAINASTGGIKWNALSGAKLGDMIQAQPAVQFRQFSNAAFQQRIATDLIFFATRNASTTSNRVVALSSATGQQVWSYLPGDLDIISGGLAVDYPRNELWVASRAGNGSQASVRVISTLDGAELNRFTGLGDIDLAVTFDYQGSTPKYALIANNSGVVIGIDLATKLEAWRHAVGVMTEYPFGTGGGFIASLANGTASALRDRPDHPGRHASLGDAAVRSNAVGYSNRLLDPKTLRGRRKRKTAPNRRPYRRRRATDRAQHLRRWECRRLTRRCRPRGCMSGCRTAGSALLRCLSEDDHGLQSSREKYPQGSNGSAAI